MPLRIVQSTKPCRRWYRLRYAFALGIGFSYGVTYLLVSWCLATGVFHPSTDTSHASHHHHHDGHAHHHHAEHDSSSSDTSWADICDFALQVLLTSAWLPSPETVDVWALGETIRRLEDGENWFQVPANLSIRSPPLAIAI